LSLLVGCGDGPLVGGGGGGPSSLFVLLPCHGMLSSLHAIIVVVIACHCHLLLLLPVTIFIMFCRVCVVLSCWAPGSGVSKQ